MDANQITQPNVLQRSTVTTDVDNKISSNGTAAVASKPKTKIGRPAGAKDTAPRKRKRASSTGLTATVPAQKRPKRETRQTLKKAEADAHEAFEIEIEDETEDETEDKIEDKIGDETEDEDITLVETPESVSSEDTIDVVRRQVHDIEAELKYERTYRGAAMVPDHVLEADEQLNVKLEAALWAHCTNGRPFDNIPAELNLEWAALVASMLDCKRFGDIRPSVLNQVWGLLNYHLEGDANATSGAVAQFMVTMVIVMGLGFQDVKSLNKFYDPVTAPDQDFILESFVTRYFDGDFDRFHMVF